MADPADLRSRARALRLTHKDIAERAGVHVVTVWRLFKHGGGLLRSSQLIEAAIVAEEDEQRKRLGTPS